MGKGGGAEHFGKKVGKGGHFDRCCNNININTKRSPHLNFQMSRIILFKFHSTMFLFLKVILIHEIVNLCLCSKLYKCPGYLRFPYCVLLYPYYSRTRTPDFDQSAFRTRSRTILLKFNPYMFRTRTSYFQKLPYPYRFRTYFKNFIRIPSLHFPYLGCTKGRNAESVSVLRSIEPRPPPPRSPHHYRICLADSDS